MTTVTRPQLAVLTGLAILFWIAGLSFGLIVSILFALVLMFDFFLWRLFIFKGWLVRRPRLWGTWRAELRPDWVDPTTGQQIPPVKGFMTIRQTYSRPQLQLYTAESQSRMLGVDLHCDENGCFDIMGVYRNEPRYSVRKDTATDSGVRPGSAIHFGAFEVKVIGDPAHTLEGHYWTDHNRGGEMILTDRYPKPIDGYDAAQRQLGQKT
jgi:hypothetical protein